MARVILRVDTSFPGRPARLRRNCLRGPMRLTRRRPTAQLALWPAPPTATLDLIPDARDGLSRIDRVVLWQLHELQKQWPGRSVPTAILYGHVIEAGLNISPAELGLILARLGGQDDPAGRAG